MRKSRGDGLAAPRRSMGLERTARSEARARRASRSPRRRVFRTVNVLSPAFNWFVVCNRGRGRLRVIGGERDQRLRMRRHGTRRLPMRVREWYYDNDPRRLNKRDIDVSFFFPALDFLPPARYFFPSRCRWVDGTSVGGDWVT